MEGDVEDPGVTPEGVLGAVAVVGVDVDDQHPLAPVGQVGGGDGHVVHQTEPHRPVRSGVVPGWAHGTEGGIGVTPLQARDGVDARPRGEQGDLPGLGADPGVGVDVAAAGPAERFQPVQVGRGVDGLQLGPGGRAGVDADQGVVEPGRGQAVEDRAESSRPLGVARPGVMVAEARMGGEEHGGHDADASGGSRPRSRSFGGGGPDAGRRRPVSSAAMTTAPLHRALRVRPWPVDPTTAHLVPCAARRIDADTLHQVLAELAERGVPAGAHRRAQPRRAGAVPGRRLRGRRAPAPAGPRPVPATRPRRGRARCGGPGAGTGRRCWPSTRPPSPLPGASTPPASGRPSWPPRRSTSAWRWSTE